MKSSTRLLVTHQRQFLPKCDRIVVVNGGVIQAIGTWEELHKFEILEAIGMFNSDHEVTPVCLLLSLDDLCVLSQVLTKQTTH